MESNIALLEIDLLRTGAHTLAVPENALAAYRPFDYAACLHPYAGRYTYAFWLTRLPNTLPILSVPLTDDLPPVPLDLQTVLNRAYVAGAYANDIDYTKEPDVPLASDMAQWASTLLTEKGLRPA